MMRVSLYAGQGYVELVSSMGSDATPARSARVSLDNDTADSTPERDAKLVKYLAEHEHLSPFEHCVATLRVRCPLFIARQVMRHRTFAFNEVSRRYVNEPPEFYVPDWREVAENKKQGSGGVMNSNARKPVENKYSIFY